MSDPLTPVLPRVPVSVAARLTEADLVAAEDPYRLGESPTEVQVRRDKASASRARMWGARVPSRFRTAALADLDPQQDPGGCVSGWLDTDSRSLVLTSTEPGVGKTHAAYAVGNAAVERGMWSLAWTMVDFNDALRPGHDTTAWSMAQECDLLVLDDVGRERITDWTLERLQGVLDARWRDARRTLITTNLLGPVFVARYGAPILDRITDGMVSVEVTGVSRRVPAPW